MAPEKMNITPSRVPPSKTITEVRRMWLTSDEAMQWLNCGRDKLDSLRDNGQVRVSKLDHTNYYFLYDLENLLASHVVNAPQHQAWVRAHRSARSHTAI